MTKEELSEIWELKKELKQLQDKLHDLQYGASDNFVTDKVSGSMSHFPFTERSFKITGYEGMSESCMRQRNEIGKKISNKYSELYSKINAAIDCIQSIENSEVRQIFTYRYIDGLKWEQIGQVMDYSWETVRKKHDKYLKSVPTNTTFKAV